MTDEKRLTAKEVAEQLSREIERLKNLNRADALWKASGLDMAIELIVDNLIPRYQDEPDGDGWYRVERVPGGIKRYEVCLIRNVGTEKNPDWFNETTGLRHWGRVCPIGERPEAGE